MLNRRKRKIKQYLFSRLMTSRTRDLTNNITHRFLHLLSARYPGALSTVSTTILMTLGISPRAPSRATCHDIICAITHIATYYRTRGPCAPSGLTGSLHPLSAVLATLLDWSLQDRARGLGINRSQASRSTQAAGFDHRNLGRERSGGLG